jgi:bifunctional non-homologous end joining protein LigD
MIIKQIGLYYKDGSSDKVYHAQIESKDNGYFVNFQYGRRESTLTAGTKTKEPVDLDKAEKIFLSLVKEKTSKGYTEGQNGAIFQSQDLGDRMTGVSPQLLNNTNERSLENLFKDSDWFMQEKFDGRRLLTKTSEETEFLAINKKGLSILIPESVAQLVKSIPYHVTLDGEIIGEKYYIFDILEYKGENIQSKSAQERYKILFGIDEINKYVVKTYFSEQEKREAFEEFKVKEKEGVVFKKSASTYISGRPASGGNQLKFKFWASATVEVIKHHKTKRSVTVAVYNNDTQINVGNVTIPVNYDIPSVGSIVEVIYLYCHLGEKGKLSQTKYKGIRDDQYLSDCIQSQLKFKAVNDEDDEDDENVLY